MVLFVATCERCNVSSLSPSEPYPLCLVCGDVKTSEQVELKKPEAKESSNKSDSVQLLLPVPGDDTSGYN